ncbi:hypothetical protein Igag_0540 [Ignisphaera aggregans DSM 17230]|uniref:Uncharacterized protein n=1 Tax=Ignisphaera aggregans (strain DSM 17230 / JCM 13409 / AQ1.S1) TaxID=583356 RepID=E0SS26_IGNAA|nr:hypothetical protein Igag_0540 [Ignisphaera aggregans DSM 17230]
MFIDSIEYLKSFAKEICTKEGVLCIDENSDVLKFSISWIENFYYIDPRECAEDLDCLKRLLEIHSYVFRLSREDKYLFYIDPNLFLDTVRRLKSL